MDLLSGLNPPQADAVETTEGPVLVLAGAGSGKTRVLTRRVAYLLATEKAQRKEILAVTFTNKAAKEMAERVSETCGRGYFPGLGTFHSVFARWLREEAEALGLHRNFAIYPSDEQKQVMKQVVKTMGLDPKKYKPQSFLSAISNMKNKMITVDDALKSASGKFDKDVAQAYQLYQKRLEDYQAVDFDDILVLLVKLFREHPDVLARYQEQYRYLMVDEYQDVNPVQYEALRLLAGSRKNLCAVGDDDQSIYRFRGADVSIILRFEEDFPQAKIIKLEQNYRSTEHILKASNEVVKNNPGRREKELWTDKVQGEKITVFRGLDGRAEARFITRTARELSHRYRFEEMAVLYRANALSRVVEEAFIQSGIPYKLVGGLRFFDRKEIKDAVAYLRVLINPYDSLSLKRIINVPPRGVGEVSWGKIQAFAEYRSLPILDVLGSPEEAGIKGKSVPLLKQLYQVFVDAQEDLSQGASVTDIQQNMLKRSGYLKMLKEEDSAESLTRLDNLEELYNVTGEFDRQADDPTLEMFLQEVSLLTDQDRDKEDENAVTLMTLHAAKGLEFPVVFLIALEEQTFPSSRAAEEEGGIEEERRLCYVGMTRAQEKLYLSFAQNRSLYSGMQAKMPSRFLDEIPHDTLVNPEALALGEIDLDDESSAPAIGSSKWQGWGQSQKASPVKKSSRTTPKFSPQVTPDLHEGDRIQHKKFGEGTVLSVSGATALINFDTIGERRLKASFVTKISGSEKANKVHQAEAKKESPVSVTTKAKDDSAASQSSQAVYPIGSKVEHKRWGKGLVRGHEGDQCVVLFPGLTLSLSPDDLSSV